MCPFSVCADLSSGNLVFHNGGQFLSSKQGTYFDIDCGLSLLFRGD